MAAEIPKKGDKKKEEQPKTTMRISKTIAQNIVFNCQSTFSTYFYGLKLPFEQSRELTLHFCKKYELDQSRTHLLLSELEQQQKNQVYRLTAADHREICFKKRQKRVTEFKNFLHIGLLIPYINNDQTLANLLCLSRETHTTLKKRVYCHALLVCEPERLLQKRKQLWLLILDISRKKVDYESLRQEVMLNRELIASVDEVIMLDVQRSEHQMPQVNPEQLTQVLRTYALYNKEIEYCQGMNYVAGLLV